MDQYFNLNNIHPSWEQVIKTALSKMDGNYLKELSHANKYLPGNDKIFNAFSTSLDQIQYILLGESPYPRIQSANGHAFWDAFVQNLWSCNGLSKEVNKATSLRNIMKMLLVASGSLNQNDTSQIAISKIPKDNLINTIDQLFNNLLDHGFLLLNASLALSKMAVNKEAKYWQPFIETIICDVHNANPNVSLILFGKISEKILQMNLPTMNQLKSEHPYNLSFISNKDVLAFFKPFNLLEA